MTLNSTPSGERLHLAFFGVRNAGKSSLVNAVTGQELCVVSPVKGTTTDPVKKAMELLPLGPVVIIDTPGIDDEGELGSQRVEKTRQILERTDIAILVSVSGNELGQAEHELLNIFAEKNIPFIIACNKADLLDAIPGNTCTCNQSEPAQNASACASASAPATNTSATSSNRVPSGNASGQARASLSEHTIYVSAKTGFNINALKEKLGAFAKPAANNKRLAADLLNPGETVVLVIPIDESAPKGRLILPQQQVIRDLLENGNIIACCRDTELTQTLSALNQKPALVITDSQAFGSVSRDTPDDILMTSFSILFARYKGSLETLIQGASKLSQLKDGDKVLISEGCTHHRQCNDIGSVKLPGWIEKFCQAKPQFSFSSGGEFPANLKDYALIVHCGGCMLNEKEMQARMRKAKEAGVPIVNYGIAIAEMHGILERSLRPFPHILQIYTH